MASPDGLPISYLIGTAYAVLGPVLPLRDIGAGLWLRVTSGEGFLPEEALPKHRVDFPLIIGVIERALFVGAVLVDHIEFVGFWLALRVAGNWAEWSEGWSLPSKKPDDKRHVSGRSVFNTFTIGASLSLLNALAGAAFAKWAGADSVDRNLVTAGALVMGFAAALTCAIWRWTTWGLPFDWSRADDE